MDAPEASLPLLRREALPPLDRRAPSESLLVFSDVHLGSDLNDNGPVVPRSVAIDADLAALLAHYRVTAPKADRWRLVIAGDFIDFVGMSIDPAPSDALTTEPSPAERRYGLGGAEDHVRLKLKRAAKRHPNVFTELARFVQAGHALTVVHGNHDLELYWASVKDDFCALLTPPGGTLSPGDVVFEPWFFYREGVAFIEHGHQYDPFCSTPYILAPLAPDDPRRVAPSLSDTLLRYIVRRTPGMKEYGHETRGLASYISWGLSLGARGTVALFARFLEAIRALLVTAKAHVGVEARAVKVEHDRRLALLAEALAVPPTRLESALELHVTSLGRTPRLVLASVMLDRLLATIVMVGMLAVAFLGRSLLGAGFPFVVAGLVAIWVVLHIVLSRGRPSVDPAAFMIERATDVARLFPSAFVVMGHTHLPATARVGANGASVYVNVGSWAEEEPEVGASSSYRAARTHLLIHATEAGHEARLCEWQSGIGPREIDLHVVARVTS